MFGDSFLADQSVHKNKKLIDGVLTVDQSWVQQLSRKYSVRNLSSPGSSNSDIFLKFVENIDNITSEDFVLIGWSDATRPYCLEKITPRLREIYMTYFYNPRLHVENQTLYMKSVSDTLIERNINHLVFWSFPTGYIGKNTSWVSRDHEAYTYNANFKNEIRPALVYFSRIELDSNLTPEAVIAQMGNDNRPNHINTELVHNELAKVVREVIEGNLSGMIDLKQRLDNVK